MVISASRRTDIPAFFADWFMDRIRAGFCSIANPFNRSQVRVVSLKPADVDAIVFWSKNPAPLIPHLGELDRLGFRYYFLYTLNDYPASLEPGVPPLAERLALFRDLALRLGPARVAWRYDPIIFSDELNSTRHIDSFSRIADELAGRTDTVILSILDWYAKTRRRLEALERAGAARFERDPLSRPDLMDTVLAMARVAAERGMSVQSCAEDARLAACGLRPGKCVDEARIRRVWGICVPGTKDKGQRPDCRCCISRDIGAPGTCRHGCAYCYAAQPDTQDWADGGSQTRRAGR